MAVAVGSVRTSAARWGCRDPTVTEIPGEQPAASRAASTRPATMRCDVALSARWVRLGRRDSGVSGDGEEPRCRKLATAIHQIRVSRKSRSMVGASDPLSPPGRFDLCRESLRFVGRAIDDFAVERLNLRAEGDERVALGTGWLAALKRATQPGEKFFALRYDPDDLRPVSVAGRLSLALRRLQECA